MITLSVSEMKEPELSVLFKWLACTALVRGNATKFQNQTGYRQRRYVFFIAAVVSWLA
jgi:hypothetical protein